MDVIGEVERKYSSDCLKKGWKLLFISRPTFIVLSCQALAASIALELYSLLSYAYLAQLGATMAEI
jgi:hypothetical protein